jgi:pyruvate/2-oxoacid:ferredoxin oxidoreductase alpha subunit
VDLARAEGMKVGLFRPITISPFPFDALHAIIGRAGRILDVEMNTGQMLFDVQLATEGRCAIDFFGRCGGLIPSVESILEQIRASVAAVRTGGCP